MFSKGDLVYIPQNVAIYSKRLGYPCVTKLKDPKMAVFIKYHPNSDLVKVAMLDGSLWDVGKKDIFFSNNEERYNVS